MLRLKGRRLVSQPRQKGKRPTHPAPLRAPAIEMIEPRLLLSGTTVNAAAVQALQDNLAHFETALGGLESIGVLANTLPLINVADQTKAGAILSFDDLVDNEILTPLTALASPGAVPADSGDLATQLRDAIKGVVGNDGGDAVFVTDKSAGSKISLEIFINDAQKTNFNVDFGELTTLYGLRTPDVLGRIDLFYTLSFRVDLETSGLPDSPTAAQSNNAFNISQITLGASLTATADFTGAEVQFGILTLTADPSVTTKLNLQASYSGSGLAMTGGTLASLATQVDAGDLSGLKGGAPKLTMTLSTQSMGPTLLDLPLLLLEENTIPGIDPITTAAHVKVTGKFADNTAAYDAAPLFSAIKTSVGNPDFDPRSLNTFAPNGLVDRLSQIGNYIDSLSGASELDIEIPFTNGVTIGEVIDTATVFKTAIIDPLADTAGILNFENGQTNTGGNYIESRAPLTADQIDNLPDNFGFTVTLNNGKTAALALTPTYLDGAGLKQHITSLNHLVAAVNQAIASSAIAGYVNASNDLGRLNLVLTAPSGQSAATKITISSNANISVFSNIREFGVSLAKTLRLDGWDQAGVAAETKLLKALGLFYNSETNGIELTISKEFELPEFSTPFEVDFSLGEVGSLSVTNAQLDLKPSVLLSLTVGFDLDPLGSDVNKPGGPVIGDGQNGTTDTKIGDLPVYKLAAGDAGANPVTARQIAEARDPDGNYASLPDLQIIGREGLVKTFILTPETTLANLETAISTAFGSNIELHFNDDGNAELSLVDDYTPYSGPSPAKQGVLQGTSAGAQEVSPGVHQAVLSGKAPSDPAYGTASKLILSVGKLAPVVVSIDSAANIDGYIAKLNTALSGIAVNPADLGLPDGTSVKYSDIVKASKNADGGVDLKTSITAAITAKQGEAPYLSTQRSAAQSTLRVDTVTLSVAAINGSLLPGLLGLVGQDVNGAAAAQSIVIGSALHGQTLADRLYLRDTGISAIIDLSLQPVDDQQDVTITGSLGPMTIEALLYDAAAPDPDLGTYVSLKASLVLNSDLNAVPNLLTFSQLTEAVANDELLSIWAFRLDSGREDQPYAQIDISGILLSAGDVQLTGAVQPHITISLEDPSGLLSGEVPKPKVEVEGFSATATAANVVEAIRQAFNALDESAANATIPLINVSADDILGFTTQFLVALDSAQNGEKGTFTEIEDKINGALGANVVKISLENTDQLIISIAYTPLSVKTELPFSLDLQSLADALGPDGGLLTDLIETVGSIASLSASGTVKVTAGASIAITLGIDLGENSSPAELATELAALNSGRGLRGATAADAQGDLRVTLGNGKSFTVSLGSLGAKPTVQSLVDGLNEEAGKVGLGEFATYDEATGALTFTDDTSSEALGLSELGFADGQAGVKGVTTVRLNAGTTITAGDYAKAFVFDIGIGSGANTRAHVELAADGERDTQAEFLTALRAALADATFSGKALKSINVPLPGVDATGADYPISAAQIIQAQFSGGKLQFSAKVVALGTDAGGNLINNLTIHTATPQLELHVESINGSTILEDLGFGGNSLTESSTGADRVLNGELTKPDSTSDRFYLKTGEDPGTKLLRTGISATVGVGSDDLNFKAGIGPFSVTVVDGSANFGADVGQKAAGTAGFKAGNAETAPATFRFGLKDGFGGSVANDGRLYFSELAKITQPAYGLSDLVSFDANAALDLTLPVSTFGQEIGDLVVQVGNLFNSTATPGAPARSVHTELPDFSNVSLTSLLNDPQTLIDGLDAFLSVFTQGPVAKALFGLNLPLIGDALQGVGTFFADLHANTIDTLQSLLDSFIAAHPGQPATSQNIITQGLNYVLSDILGVPGEVYSYIDSIADPKEISFVWHFEKVLFDETVNIDASLGIPGLGLDVENGDIQVKGVIEATIGFGYLKDKGFYVYTMGTPKALKNFASNNDPGNIYTADFSEMHAFDLSIVAYLPASPAFQATINLGFLRMTATNGSELKADFAGETILGTSLTGTLYVDIGPKATSPRLLFSEFSKQPVVRVGVLATVNVDLLLDAGFGFGSTSMALPSVSTELLFSYTYSKVFVGATGAEPESGVEIPITFKDVTLDLGDFLTKILKPIIDTLDTVIDPVRPILDFLTAPIPGLSDIIGPTSMLDLAQTLGGKNKKIAGAIKFIRVLDEVSDLVRTLADIPDGQNIGINFGTFVLGKTDDPNARSLSNSNVDPFGGKVKNTDISATEKYYKDNPAAASAAKDKALSQLASKSGTKVDKQVGNLSKSGGKPTIDFPILSNPLSAVKLLLGMDDPVDLVKVTLPVFELDFTASKTFYFAIGPVPVSVEVYMNVGATIKLAFGYDTLGIQHFLKDPNPLYLFDGFYVDNTIAPQLSFHATFGVKAAIDLLLVKAGVGGELTGEVNFTLVDVTGTGKVRFTVILEELFDNPLKIFKIDGNIKIRIFAFAWVGVPFVDITIFEASFDIINVTLLDFSYDYAAEHSTPKLAHLTDDGELQLNLGENAERQAVGGNIADPDQEYSIRTVGGSAGNEDIEITANGVTTVYKGVKKVTASLGDGDNKVKFTGGIQSAVTLVGGDGNNIIDLSGVIADPLLVFGDGDNMIVGSPTEATTIIAGNGNNTITGGNVRNTITAGNGRNIITGGTEVDIIEVGDGDNIIYGNAGDDEIRTGGGNNTIFGGSGANLISIGNSAGNNIIFGDGPNTEGDAASATVTDLLVSLNNFAGDGLGSTITGGAGNDIIFGGDGDNSITGVAGRDAIFGARGQVTRTAALQYDVVSSDELAGGDNVILAGSGDSIILGGTGNNTITGGAGRDTILGSIGEVEAAGHVGPGGLFKITGAAVGGNNSILGGGNDDVIMGGAGANTINGGNGDDIILGHQGVLNRSGTGSAATLVNVETTNESAGGNSSVIGGAGRDVILGGAGSHTIDAGTGNDVVITHFGRIDATAGGNALTIVGRNSAGAGNGDSTITASHSAIIMGGGGNDTITTLDFLAPAGPGVPAVTSADRTQVLFGGNGRVVADYVVTGGFKVHQAATQATEENTGGNNVITTADGNNFVFGGSGTNTITTGQGSSIIFGHLGAIDLDRLATPDLTGKTPDVLGFIRGQDGTTLSTTGSTIVSGNGNNIIMGGAGNNSIAAGTGNNIVFGGAGSLTRDGRVGGNNALLFAQSVEEAIGGNARIILGPDGLGANHVWGGAGTNVIQVGNGTNIVFGHLGVVNNVLLATFTPVQRADGARADIIGRSIPEIGAINGTPWPTAKLDQLLDVPAGGTIIAGRGNNIIMGGAGNNVISVGDGNNALFGGSGAVTRTAVGGTVLVATTVEESIVGNAQITAGNGRNMIFGGAGNNLITVGDRDNIIFGHLGQVNLGAFLIFTDAQRVDGTRPDIFGRVLPELGNRAPRTTAPFSGLDQPLAGGSTIHAGNGNNVIMGGAGDNTIVAGYGANVIFGAAGAVTRDATNRALVYATTVEEAQGGDNVIAAGLRGFTSQVIFGGPGFNRISAGPGDNVILGHLGYIDIGVIGRFTAEQRADGTKPDIVARIVPELGNVFPSTAGGNALIDQTPVRGGSVINVGRGDNIVLGGAGDNTITTGSGRNIVFGAAGAVTRDARTLDAVVAETVEETKGGNNVLRLGSGANGDNVGFGGPGNSTIIAGNGSNVLLGHLGKIDYTVFTSLTPAQRADGSSPDIVSRTIPVKGNVTPATTAPFGGLNTPLPTTGATIIAGRGDNVILGGAGANTISVGDGNNLIYGASGKITRTGPVGTLVTSAETEAAAGQVATITLGKGTNTVFNGGGGSSGHAPMQHVPQLVFVVSGTETLAAGQSLAALAVEVQAQRLTPAAAPAPAGFLPQERLLQRNGGTLFDERTGAWTTDTSAEEDGAPRLLDVTVAAPLLDLGPAEASRDAA